MLNTNSAYAILFVYFSTKLEFYVVLYSNLFSALRTGCNKLLQRMEIVGIFSLKLNYLKLKSKNLLSVNHLTTKI